MAERTIGRISPVKFSRFDGLEDLDPAGKEEVVLPTTEYELSWIQGDNWQAQGPCTLCRSASVVTISKRLAHRLNYLHANKPIDQRDMSLIAREVFCGVTCRLAWEAEHA